MSEQEQLKIIFEALHGCPVDAVYDEVLDEYMWYNFRQPHPFDEMYCAFRNGYRLGKGEEDLAQDT